MLTYAVPDDLITGDWLDGSTAPDNAVTLIRYASLLVRRATRNDLYYTEPSGLPIDDDFAEAMRDATCCHAAMWSLAGINPAAGTVGRVIGIQSQSADGGNVTYADSVKADEIAATLDRLSEAAIDILRSVGLASSEPTTW
jgi:hypothetical protein